MASSISAYIRFRHHSVHGWLNPISGKIIEALASAQANLGADGCVAEIGVHHGKLAILLMLLAPDEPFYAIDIFDRQDLNIDASGHGSKQAFLRNVKRLLGKPDLHLIADSSFNVRPDQLPESVRLFSVDGGHTIECTKNDLHLAASCLSDRGCIILDDVFNESWTEVATGLVEYLAEIPEVIPFATSPNKVYLCRPAWRDSYQSALKRAAGSFYDRRLRMFGHEVDIYGMRASSRSWLGYLAAGSSRVIGLFAKAIPG